MPARTIEARHPAQINIGRAPQPCHHGPCPWIPWRGAEITIYVWCAIGAVAGWLAGVMMASKGIVQRLEEVSVGIFGAVVGAEITKAVFLGGSPDTGVGAVGIATAVAGAVLFLALLKMMRGAVGPLRAGKSPSARRR